MKRIVLAFVTPMLVMVAAVGAAPPAMAAAVVTRQTFTSPSAVIGLPDDCRPGITGDLSGTDVANVQSVETSTGFHVQVTATSTVRIDWSDGSYTIGESVDHISFTTGKEATVFTNAHEDSGNTYSASGVLLFRITFHLVEHFTVNGGVTSVRFERGHLHGFGVSC